MSQQFLEIIFHYFQAHLSPISLQAPLLIKLSNHFSLINFMRLRLSSSCTKKRPHLSRGNSTYDGTPNLISRSESRITHSKGRTLLTATAFRESINQRFDQVVAGKVRAVTAHSSPPVFEVPDRETHEVFIAERLEQMKEDKLMHLLYKNRIKKRLYTAKNESRGLITPDKSQQQPYYTSQHQTLSTKPKYDYLHLKTTFYSRAKRRIFDEVFQQSEMKDYCTRPISEKMEKERVNYLKYSSNRKHRMKFRETVRCKTEGVCNLERSREEILRLFKEGSEIQTQVSGFLEHVLVGR